MLNFLMNLQIKQRWHHIDSLCIEANAWLMLAHRLGHWTNIRQALDQQPHRYQTAISPSRLVIDCGTVLSSLFHGQPR